MSENAFFCIMSLITVMVASIILFTFIEPVEVVYTEWKPMECRTVQAGGYAPVLECR